ncbi:MAG: hypothetical protein QF472_05870 [Candidatus Marinimicrobia bacterium]|nr:hypothetical protein [Candidatus Neomarinimicrobiota bacterium]
MQYKITLLIFTLFFLTSCRVPSDPEGKLNIVHRLETIDTGGECVDVDISDSLLVAAVNYNGFQLYQLKSQNGNLEYDEISSSQNFAFSLGDDQIEGALLSVEDSILILMDEEDYIYFADHRGNPLTSLGGKDNCMGSRWQDIDIDKSSENPMVFSLIRHSAGEAGLPGELNIYNDYSKSLVWWKLEDIKNNITEARNCARFINFDFTAEIIHYGSSGFLLIGMGELGVKIHKQLEKASCFQNITSKTVKAGFDISVLGNVVSAISWEGKTIKKSIEGEKSILLTLKLSTAPETMEDIQFYSSAGEIMGNVVFSSDATMGNNRIWIESGENNTYHIYFTSEEDIARYQFALSGVDMITPVFKNYSIAAEYSDDSQEDADILQCESSDGGLNGSYEIKGGVSPNEFLSFDTPGEVDALFMEGLTIYAGLSSSNGCLKTRIDQEGNIISKEMFAGGYSIRGIHSDGSILALAAGHDGILVYKNNDNNLSFLGRIATSYAHVVKVADNTIYAGTEDGIDIIQIVP